MSKEIGLFGISSQQDLLEEAFDNSNQAVDLFNQYIKAKNNQFKAKRYAVELSKIKLDNAKSEIESAIGIYKSIEVDDKKATAKLNKSVKQCEKLRKEIEQELVYLGGL